MSRIPLRIPLRRRSPCALGWQKGARARACPLGTHTRTHAHAHLAHGARAPTHTHSHSHFSNLACRSKPAAEEAAVTPAAKEAAVTPAEAAITASTTASKLPAKTSKGGKQSSLKLKFKLGPLSEDSPVLSCQAVGEPLSPESAAGRLVHVPPQIWPALSKGGFIAKIMKVNKRNSITEMKFKDGKEYMDFNTVKEFKPLS